MWLLAIAAVVLVDVRHASRADARETRDGSGTSWMPDASPMYAFHWQRGKWQVMVHESPSRSLTRCSPSAKLQGGYTRALATWFGLKAGLGGTLSAGFVPADLSTVYGGRVNVGWGVFLALRPAANTTHDAEMHDHSQHQR
jgi:hypothetical protein